MHAIASMVKSALPSKPVERRRASAPALPRGVQFRRETSIASVHFVDPDAPPERHLSDEPGMQIMDAGAKERRVCSLRHKRNDDNPLLSRQIRMLPTPARSGTG